MKVPILLVDDLRANLVALEAMLSSGDYELVSVTSGSDALTEFEQRDFAAILIALRMPVMDGIETARIMRARANEFTRHVPIIVVTATDTDRTSMLGAYASGVVDFMQKPLEPAVLSAKVGVFAQLFRARELVRLSGEKLERERRGAEQSAQRFQLLVESVRDYAIFMLDPKGIVSTWNAGAEHIKGYTAAEITGKHFSVFYPPEDMGKCERELEVAKREGRFEEEGWRIRKDGARFWANVTITALHDHTGALVGFAKVTRDLTERVRHEETRRQLAAEKAKLAEKARTQEFQERFIAVLGHDLRTPLTSIELGTALLGQRAAKTKDDAALRALDRMRRSVHRMSRMIGQILDLTRSRLDGALQMEPVTMDLCATITSIADELRAAHPGRAIEVRALPSATGRWDPDRLEQVFSNLIGNAIQYGLPERPVRVEVVEDAGGIGVSVHNEGPPIPKTLQEEIFNPFRRGERDCLRSETEGLGLGLYISREIVATHGGNIEVRSSAIEGTTFLVTLPRAQKAS